MSEDRNADIDRIQSCLSSRYHRFLLHTREETPTELFEALQRFLPQIDPHSWQERAAWGGVFVNGIEANQNCSLPVPCKLEYYEPAFDIRSAEQYFPPWRESFILYRERGIVVVYKPPGLPAMPAKEQKHFNLKSYLERFLGGTAHFPSRLDMSTAGILVCSEDPDLHDRLQKLFERRTIDKRYRLATGSPVGFENLSAIGSIGRDRQHPVLRTVDPTDTRSKSARTTFRVLYRGKHPELEIPYTMLEAQPHTGRTHQIRVHAASLGTPIIGDNFYGGRHATGLHLLSYSLRFAHPATGKEVSLSLPPEFSPAWNQREDA